ncbi:MAG: zinc ABC transporter substrate-binding protein [Bacteroidales bacterium]|nr:zinc ABC transporter substrate-binding protein [Bacteroidales bacterium]
MKTKCTYQATAVALTLLAIGAGCRSNDADDRPVLVVSIEPQKYMLEQIVGDDFKIVTLMPNGDNPETFEPSMSGRMAVDKADAYFTTGYFPFESNLNLTADNPEIIISTSEGIDLIYGTHAHVDEHHTFLHADSTHQVPDPHVWTSVRNARMMSRTMLETVKRINPDKADTYTGNFNRFDQRLDSLDRSFSQRLDSLDHKSFLVWHPSLSYFARDYGLEQIAVGSEGKESSMNSMRRVIDDARADSVSVFFYQRDVDSRQAEAVNSGVGSRLVPINTSQYDWEDGMILIVDELTAGK